MQSAEESSRIIRTMLSEIERKVEEDQKRRLEEQSEIKT